MFALGQLFVRFCPRILPAIPIGRTSAPFGPPRAAGRVSGGFAASGYLGAFYLASSLPGAGCRDRPAFGGAEWGTIAMTKLATLFTALAATFLCPQITPAQAQSARTFVSANGVDNTNPCSRAAPCRTFAYALTQTNAGGEINTLDPAGYGAVTITKSVSIVSGLGEAGVLVTSAGTGITINAGANDAVNLRGLIIEGAGVGANGIVFNTGKSLAIENCVVRNVTANGIAFAPNYQIVSSGTSSLFISNTLVANTGNIGISVAPASDGIIIPTGTFKAVLSHVDSVNNAIGILVDGTFVSGKLDVTASHSVAAHNGTGMLLNTETFRAPTTLLVNRSAANNNGTGLRIGNGGSNAIIQIAQTTVSANTTGISFNLPSAIQSYGDNYMLSNTNNSGSLTSISKQ
jgi:hypothetical protein